MSTKQSKKKASSNSGRVNSPSLRAKSPKGKSPSRSNSPSQRVRSPKDKQKREESAKSLTDHVSAAEKVLYDLR